MAVAARKNKQVELYRQTVKDREEKQFAAIRMGSPEYGWLRSALAQLNEHRCPICWGKETAGSKAVFDHHHGLGVARSVLCRNCNIALGYPENALGDRAMTASIEEWKLASTGFVHPDVRKHVEGVGDWAERARDYYVKWTPVVEALGEVYRQHIGPGKRIGSPAKDQVAPATFAALGEVLVQQSQRIRALYTPEKIAAKREWRKERWPTDWVRALHGEGVLRPMRGEGEAWVWERVTRVVSVMLAALDWMAEIRWQAMAGDLPADAATEGAFPVLAVDVGWIEGGGTIWRAVSHKGLTLEALTQQIGRAV